MLSLLPPKPALHNSGIHVIHELSHVACGHQPVCGMQDLGNAIWAFATLGHSPGMHLLADMCAQLAAGWAQQEGVLLSQELSKLLLALAMFTYHPGADVLNSAVAQAHRCGPLIDSSGVNICIFSPAAQRLQGGPDL